MCTEPTKQSRSAHRERLASRKCFQRLPRADIHTLYSPHGLVCAQHYGLAIKTLINEQCGDGIMSAIDFFLDVGTTTGKLGEKRVVITFVRSTLPCRIAFHPVHITRHPFTSRRPTSPTCSSLVASAEWQISSLY